jgi:glutamate 5-kinase
MAIIERFNLTIRNKIETYMTTYKTYKYIDVLDKLVSNHNNSKSFSTGYKPVDVDDEIEKEIYSKKALKKVIVLNEINNTFEIGNTVKILKEKKMFSKGSTQYYSKNSYIITGNDGLKFVVKNLENGKIRTALPY